MTEPFSEEEPGLGKLRCQLSVDCFIFVNGALTTNKN